MSNNQAQRTVVSVEVFEKEVEKEFAFLTWIEYMDEREAKVEARKRVSQVMVTQAMVK